MIPCLDCHFQRIQKFSCIFLIKTIIVWRRNVFWGSIVNLPGVNLYQCVLLLVNFLSACTVVVQCEPGKYMTLVHILCLHNYLVSRLWDFNKSMFGLKRTPQSSSTQVSHIGLDGDLSLDPSLRDLLIFLSLYHNKRPTSFLSGIPNFPSVN